MNWVQLTGQRGKVRLDVQLLQQHSSWKVNDEITPGLLRQEDV